MTAWNSLKQSVLTTEQVRRVDLVAMEKYHMHSLVLMENAALSCVSWLKDRYPEQPRTLILCGRGNNGGDGLVIARHLLAAGWECHCLLLGPVNRLSADNRANWEILYASSPSKVRLVEGDAAVSGDLKQEVAQGELIIDAMLGTGVTGEPRSPFREWIEWSNAQVAQRVAIDIPTGVNAEAGEVGECHFQADATLTFVAHKPAMQLKDAFKLFGDINVCPIGLPVGMMEEILSWSS
ncbi:MAG: NAD(P)H-hydrate epimerase [Planctomycetota bacterium]